MDRWKSTARKKLRHGESQNGEDKRRRRSDREKVRREKMQVRNKIGKSRNTVFFPVFCGSGWSKSRLSKAAGAEPAGQVRDEKLHAVVERSAFGRKTCTTHPSFGPLLEIENIEMLKKCTPLRPGSTFGSENGKSTRCSDHCISTVWRFDDDSKSQKCTPFWREETFPSQTCYKLRVSGQ